MERNVVRRISLKRGKRQGSVKKQAGGLASADGRRPTLLQYFTSGHMKLLAAVIGLLVLTAVAMVALGPWHEALGDDTLRIVSFSSDKGAYHSREKMPLTLTVESGRDRSAHVLFHGIYSRGWERVNVTSEVRLMRGTNRFVLPYETPSCVGCAGIIPGNYTISADVESEGQRMALSTVVDIRQ